MNDEFIAVVYDSKLDSYIAACSGKRHKFWSVAVQEAVGWGIPHDEIIIARRHGGRWFIGDVHHAELEV